MRGADPASVGRLGPAGEGSRRRRNSKRGDAGYFERFRRRRLREDRTVEGRPTTKRERLTDTGVTLSGRETLNEQPILEENGPSWQRGGPISRYRRL
jgi:hypothetical protein